MAQSYDLIEAQVGTEVTWGTPVAATARLSGVQDITLDPVAEAIIVEEMRGNVSRGRSSEKTRVQAAGSISAALCYEDAPYYFDNLILQDTPSGAGPYTYGWNVPQMAGGIQQAREFTLYKGIQGGGSAYRAAGMVGTELKISGEHGAGPIMVEHSMIGEMTEVDTLSVLSDRAATWIMPHQVAFYIDDFGTGTIGSTQLTGIAWYSFELTVANNRVLTPSMESLLPIGYHERNYNASLSLNLEVQATSQGWLNTILATSGATFKKQIRIVFTSGTDKLQLDFAGGALEAPEIFTENDGVINLELDLEEIEDVDGLGDWLRVEVDNDIASMP